MLLILCRSARLLLPGLLAGLGLVLLAAACLMRSALAQPALAAPDSPPAVTPLPRGAVLVKGAVPSASDTQTPVPEEGTVGAGAYDNGYFGLHMVFPTSWLQKHAGPPPSDSGYYVLAQLQPADPAPGAPAGTRGGLSGKAQRGTLQIVARDLFFTPLAGGSARALLAGMQADLQPVYQLDEPLTQLPMAGHPFVHLAYSSAPAGLRWSLWATEVRCHLLQFVVTSPDPGFIEASRRLLQQLKLPIPASADGGGEAPVCIAGYANGEQLIHRVEPVLPPGRPNPIPVRIIIDTNGQVRHIHILCAFPEQAQAVNSALHEWRFKPYMTAGHAAEVETGVLFGRAR